MKANFYNKIIIFWIISLSILSNSFCIETPSKDINLNRNIWIDKVRYGWQALPKTKSLCPEFDYFPDGGIRNFYCHLKDISNYLEVEKYFGNPIFLKGPHKDGFLILDDHFSFGHYNPNFPIFLRETLIPGSKDKSFRILTQPIYNNYVKNLARIYFVTYMKLQSNQLYLTSERLRYKNLIERKILDPYYYEKYYGFMEPGFTDSGNPNTSNKFLVLPGDESFDGNVVKSSVLFWIRRSIDGTDKEFFNGLRLLLNTYDTDFIKSR